MKPVKLTGPSPPGPMERLGGLCLSGSVVCLIGIIYLLMLVTGWAAPPVGSLPQHPVFGQMFTFVLIGAVLCGVLGFGTRTTSGLIALICMPVTLLLTYAAAMTVAFSF